MASPHKKVANAAAYRQAPPTSVRSNALFFPYISLPEIDWTFHTLLYWDKLASIVPLDHVEDPGQLSPFMRELVREELVEQVFPGAYLWQMPEFGSSFEQHIRKRVSRLAGSPIRAERRVQIHMEKMESVSDVLVSLEVAEAVSRNWYAVDESVANIFMAYLATCLGAVPGVNAAPVTHETKYLTIFGDLRNNYPRFDSTHKAKARTVILRSLLPRPAEKMTLDQLLRFKARHAKLLPEFRLLVETQSAKIARIADADERAQATECFLRESQRQADEIAAAMAPTWKKVTFGSLVPLFGAGLALQGAVAGGKASLYASAGLSFAGAAYRAISNVRGNRERMAQPLAYVAHAKTLRGVG